MPLLSDVVRAEFVRNGIVEGLCFENIEQFLAAFPSLYSIEIPSNITNVIVSNVQPLDSQRNAVWFRYSNAGIFIGIYVFSNGAWMQIFPPPQGVFWFYGDSNTPQPGYELIDASNAPVVAAIGLADVTALVATYQPAGSTPPFTVFACSFIGF